LPIYGEGPIGEATIKQALYWRQIYSEILAMEEQVVVAQAERLRQRLSYWEARVVELGGAPPLKV